MKNKYRLTDRHQELLDSKSFRNSQNYVISDMKKYIFYNRYLKKKSIFLKKNSLWIWLISRISFYFLIIYYLRWWSVLFIPVFILVYRVILILNYFFKKTIWKDISLVLFKKFKSNRKKLHYIFRKEIGGDYKKYLFSLKK